MKAPQPSAMPVHCPGCNCPKSLDAEYADLPPASHASDVERAEQWCYEHLVHRKLIPRVAELIAQVRAEQPRVTGRMIYEADHNARRRNVNWYVGVADELNRLLGRESGE